MSRRLKMSRQTMTPFEQQRRDWCAAAHTVLANAHVDHALIAWAQQTGRLRRIDRTSAWGSPTELHDPNDDVEREACVRAYAAYFDTRSDLQARLDDLAGKVLACWCTPKECHGLVLMGLLEPQFTAEYLVMCTAVQAQNARPAPPNQLSLW